MTVDWSHFTPWSSLVGGLVIGLASLLLVLGNGRIAGIAGIVGGALQALLGGQGLRNNAVRWLFLAGLIACRGFGGCLRRSRSRGSMWVCWL